MSKKRDEIYISQNGVEHALFLGIPIDGDIESFTRKLSAKGFVRDKNIGDSLSFNGRFANENVIVSIANSLLSGTVYRVNVIFPRYIWSELKSAYNRYKGLLTSKYGESFYSKEYFDEPYYDGCGMETIAIEAGSAEIVSFYEYPDGMIELRIFCADVYSGVMISYEDSKNRSIFDKENDEQALNDL